MQRGVGIGNNIAGVCVRGVNLGPDALSRLGGQEEAKVCPVVFEGRAWARGCSGLVFRVEESPPQFRLAEGLYGKRGAQVGWTDSDRRKRWVAFQPGH